MEQSLCCTCLRVCGPAFVSVVLRADVINWSVIISSYIHIHIGIIIVVTMLIVDCKVVAIHVGWLFVGCAV